MPALAKPLLDLAAQDLMNRDVTSIPRDMSMQAAARWLSQRNISGAPVVDEKGRCIGVISSSDFVACCAANLTPCMKHRTGANHGTCAFPDCVGSEWQIVNEVENKESLVCDHMTPDPVTVQAATPIVHLAQMMIDAHVHRIVVVNEEFHPLGILSTTDIVAAVARAGHEV